IRTVIGPSGKQINKIIEETDVKIDIEQDGSVSIASTEAHKIAEAKQIIEDLVREAKVGEIYLGTVKRIEKFGAFVEIFKGKEDRKSTRLNSSHVSISYAVFCLKKK